VQLVGDFFDSNKIGSTSLGVVNGPKSDDLHWLSKVKTDLSDNGIYLVRRTGEETVVRRFTESYEGTDEGHLREWTSARVDAEREAAMKHEYHKGIQETFKQIQGNRKISNY
jgi:hypothetical protein